MYINAWLHKFKKSMIFVIGLIQFLIENDRWCLNSLTDRALADDSFQARIE